MRIEKNAAIMFADICGSTPLYESLGDGPAHKLVATLMRSVDQLIERHKGLVVKHIGDEVLAVFDHLENASDCALHIHQLSADASSTYQLRMKIGIRYGSVFLENADVFGDTVNTAARIVSLAKPGQTLVGAEICSIKLKSGGIRSIGFHGLKGKKSETEIYELLGVQARNLTTRASPSQPGKLAPRKLRLTINSESVEVTTGQKIVIGRDIESDLQIDHPLVSREHAVVEGIRNRFVLRDHSTNGLTVLANDGKEYVLHREGITLVGRGRIYFGTHEIDSGDVPIVRYDNSEE